MTGWIVAGALYVLGAILANIATDAAIALQQTPKASPVGKATMVLLWPVFAFIVVLI